MPRKLSHHAASLSQSAIRAMSIECAAVGGLNLAQGICDTEVPEAVARAVAPAVAAGHNTYSRYDGTAELRAALAEKMRKHCGLTYDADSEIVATNGATGAFHTACSALLEPGDEVILFEPFYGYHVATLRLLDLVPVGVALAGAAWDVPWKELQAAVTERTRAIVVNTPANPCGKVFSSEEITALGELAERHDLWIFTDEVYEHFVFDGRRHVSPAAVDGLRERTITMSSLSKTLAITGWRLGWMAADRRWAASFGPLADLVYVCPPTPLQQAVAAGLTELGPDYYAEIATSHQAKRDRICRTLEEVGLVPSVPEGAYYVLADCSRLPGSSGWDRARHLLAATGVAAVPGEAFFHDERAATMLRFCFGKTDADLEEACHRLARLG
jgi:aminotransferase